MHIPKPIALAAALAAAATLPAAGQQRPVTLDDLYAQGVFRARGAGALRSMADGLHYTAQRDGALVKYSYKTGEAVDTLVRIGDLGVDDIQSFAGYRLSDDERRVIFMANVQPIYRRSFTADYYVWDLAQRRLARVSEQGGERCATLSPDGKKVAFARGNNLYISDLEGGIDTVTTDGSANAVINGTPDWVYEEEFGYNQAFGWSADGQRLAWCRFDESRVAQHSMPRYKGMAPEHPANELHPEIYTYKYPKAGESNSAVSVHVYDLSTGRTLGVDIGPEADIYIPRIYWTPDAGTLAVARLNRRQDRLEVLYADAATGRSRVVYTDSSRYYVDQPAYEALTFIDANTFIVMSEADGWSHLYLRDAKAGATRQITRGEFDVTDLLGHDARTGTVYYRSTEEGPANRCVRAIPLKGGKSRAVSTQAGTNSATFSRGYQYYILSHSSASEPTRVTLHDSRGRLIRTLEDNAQLRERLAGYQIAPKEFFTIKTADSLGGVELRAWMTRPADFDSTRRYPVVMTQYSGPNSQEVLNRWGMDLEQALAAQGIITVCVDGRGTGGRGESFRKCTYLQLGRHETRDQIAAARHLQSLPYVDPERIGIWGWSYGGFMALNCMTQGAEVFHTGVAVAPVTNWRYYDNIYTERFMRTPAENPSGYDDNSPTTHAAKLRGNLLVVTGSFDDNVHPSNTYEFTEALVQAGRPFDMMVYTNRNHSIYGGNTRMHLFAKILDYFQRHLSR